MQCWYNIGLQFKIRIVPSIGVIALSSEEIHVILELQLEDKVFVDSIFVRRLRNGVAQQRQTRQWEIVLVGFVEK